MRWPRRPPPNTLQSAVCDFFVVFLTPDIHMDIWILKQILHKKNARGRLFQMIICTRPVPPDDHLQPQKRAWKTHFWDPSQWNRICFEYQRIKFQWRKWVKIYTFAYGLGGWGWLHPPPSPYDQPDRKISVFFNNSPIMDMKTQKLAFFVRYLINMYLGDGK